MLPSEHTSPELLAQLARMESFLARDPGNRELLATVIDLRLAAAQPERAQQGVDAALALFPADPFFRARGGNVLIATAQWEPAAALYAELLAAGPEVHLAYNLALAYFWLGRHAQALALLAPYAASGKAGPEAVTLLVRVLHHLGQLEQAFALVQGQFEHCKGDPEFLAAASLACLDGGYGLEAAQFSALALGAGVRPVAALVVAGNLALGRADPEQARRLFGEVLLRWPREARSWSGAGMASLVQRDVPGATAQLERALKLMPDDVGTLHGLAWCKIADKDLAAAELLLRRALATDAGFAETHGALAVVAALRGERAPAEAGIAMALALGDSHAARYAQQLLSGEQDGAMRFEPLAQRLLSTGKGVAGVPGYAQRGHVPRAK